MHDGAQHPLDGIEQRVAPWSTGVTRQRTMSRAGRTLAQRPDMRHPRLTAAPTTAPTLRAGAARSSEHQTRRAVRRYLASFDALAPSRETRCALPPVIGLDAPVQLAGVRSTHSNAPRTVPIEGVDARWHDPPSTAPCAGRLVSILPNRSAAPSRSIAAYARRSSLRRTLFISRAHESNHTLLGVGEDLTNPRRYPLRRILDHHPKDSP